MPHLPASTYFSLLRAGSWDQSYSLIPCMCTYYVAGTGLSTRDTRTEIVFVLKKLLEELYTYKEANSEERCSDSCGAWGRQKTDCAGHFHRGVATLEKVES